MDAVPEAVGDRVGPATCSVTGVTTCSLYEVRRSVSTQFPVLSPH